MRDVRSNVDIDRVRQERESRKNPPSLEGGLNDFDIDDSIFSDDFSQSDNNDMNSDLNNFGSINSSGSIDDILQGNIQQPQNQQYPQNQQQKRGMTDEEVFDSMVKGAKAVGKGSVKVSKGLVEVFSGNSYKDLFTINTRIIKVSGSCTIIGLLFSIIGLFTGYPKNALPFFLGSLLTVGLSFGTYGGILEKSVKEVQKEKVKKEKQKEEQEDIPFNDIEEDTSEDTDNWYNEDEDESNGWDFGDDDEDEFDFSGGGSILDTEGVSFDTPDFSEQEELSVDEALKTIPEIDKHTQTRQFLFEQYMKVLPKITPSFSEMVTLSEDSYDFLSFYELLRKASALVGIKEEYDYVELLEVRENKLIYQLVSDRKPSIRKYEEQIAEELANMYSRDKYGALIHEGSYATVNSVGDQYIINLFKGDNIMVSLADIYLKEKDYILNTDVRMPAIWGINELGNVWKCDLCNIYSLIVSGEARTGKSWRVQSLILQMCMFNSPRDVVFEVFDVKGKTSDYVDMFRYMPHFKKFLSEPIDILKRLRYICEVESKRRESILAQYNAKSLDDLKKVHPEVELPYLYILIDEMAGLQAKLGRDKELKDEYQDCLKEIITQFPNLGIKLFLVPHRIINEIINKTTYMLVGCRVSVKASFEDMKASMGITKSSFPYTLSKRGDMALKVPSINNGKPVYSHGEVITTTNDGNNEIFRFVGELWKRLEGDENKNESPNRGLNNSNSIALSDITDADLDEFMFN